MRQGKNEPLFPPMSEFAVRLRESNEEALRTSIKRTKKWAASLLMAVIAVIPFAKGLPLNTLYRPWGVIASLLAVLALVGTFWNLTGLMLAYLARRDGERLLRRTVESTQHR